MKTVLIGATVAMSITSGAYAGSPTQTQIIAEPQIADVFVAPAPLWGGFYAGLSAGKAMGDLSYADSLTYPLGSGDFDLDGEVYGAFAGYNIDMQPFVLGLELSALKGQIDREETDGTLSDPAYNLDRVWDLKARAGYAFGRLLVSGIVGYSTAKWEENNVSATADGISYGLGADYLVTDNIFVGAEYLRRNLESDDSPVPAFDADLNTLQLRVGMKF